MAEDFEGYFLLPVHRPFAAVARPVAQVLPFHPSPYRLEPQKTILRGFQVFYCWGRRQSLWLGYFGFNQFSLQLLKRQIARDKPANDQACV